MAKATSFPREKAIAIAKPIFERPMTKRETLQKKKINPKIKQS